MVSERGPAPSTSLPALSSLPLLPPTYPPHAAVDARRTGGELVLDHEMKDIQGPGGYNPSCCWEVSRTGPIWNTAQGHAASLSSLAVNSPLHPHPHRLTHT